MRMKKKLRYTILLLAALFLTTMQFVQADEVDPQTEGVLSEEDNSDDADAGDTNAGDADSDDTDADDADAGDEDSEDTDSGNVNSGDADSGDEDSETEDETSDIGWKKAEDGFRWQYIDEKTKKAVTSSFRVIGDKTYYLDENGYLLCDGLFKAADSLGAKAVYFAQKAESSEDTPLNSSMGALIKNQWFLTGNKEWRYFGSDGKAAAPQNGWQFIHGEWYWLKNGVAMTGWQWIGAEWYYLSPEDGVMLIGWQWIGGQKYYLSSSRSDGTMKIGWQKIDGNWYYLSGSKSDGSMKIGWQKINGSWYFLGENSNDGSMKIGWQKIKGCWYYLSSSLSDGSMKYGWQKINGSSYYLGGADDGSMKYGWQFIGSAWYYFGDADDGAMKTGWQKVGDDWYFMYSSGVMASSTWIGSYYVNSSGRWVEMDYVWPLTGYTYISSDFGYRTAPTAGASTNHNGIDIPAPAGTPIRAVADGTVVTRGSDSGNGNYIKIDHGNGLVTAYLHMSGFAVSWGTQVTAGQVIGYVGTTGISTGNHLHISFYENGTAVSPWNYLQRM